MFLKRILQTRSDTCSPLHILVGGNSDFHHECYGFELYVDMLTTAKLSFTFVESGEATSYVQGWFWF